MASKAEIQRGLDSWEERIRNSRQSTRYMDRAASRSGDEPARKVRPRSGTQ